jgi:hypothetical protein
MRRVSFVIAVLAALALGAGALQGCAKQEPAQPASGSAPASAAAQAPASAVAAGPVGTWQLDNQVVKDAMMADIAAIEDPEERQAMELGMAMMGAGMIDEMVMILALEPDGSASSTTSMMGDSETVHGKWSTSGEMLIIEMEQDGASEAIAARIDGDTLELIPPEGEEMPFRMIMRRRAE